jgi:hypothetical protein
MIVEGKFGKGKWVIGDLCYCLKKDIYDNIFIEKYGCKDGFYDSDNFAVGSTVYGDGTYKSEGFEMNFDVDAGIIGITSIDNCNLNSFVDKEDCIIVDVKEEVSFTFEDGFFEFIIDGKYYIINTYYSRDNDYPNDNDYFEDEI